MGLKHYLVLIAMCIGSGPLKGETINITNGEWEPYLSQSSPHYGLASHIVEEAFDQVGITVKWGFFPWIRSYEKAKEAKDWEASAVWWPTEDAHEHFLLSVPVVETSNVFFHLKTRPIKWQQFSDLKGLKIGVTRGYDYGEAFHLAVKQGHLYVQEVSSDEMNLRKLMTGRIDVFPNDPVVGFAQIRNNFSEHEAIKFTHHPKEFEKTTLHLLISKRSPRAKHYITAFNRGMRLLAEQGEIQRMIDQLKSGYYDQAGSKRK